MTTRYAVGFARHIKIGGATIKVLQNVNELTLDLPRSEKFEGDRAQIEVKVCDVDL